MSKRHTFLLIQTSENQDTRTWADYETTPECLEAICKIYEEFLKKRNPGKTTITYEVLSLFKFIEDLYDLCVFMLNKDTAQYEARPKDWVKEKIFAMLRNEANYLEE